MPPSSPRPQVKATSCSGYKKQKAEFDSAFCFFFRNIDIVQDGRVLSISPQTVWILAFFLSEKAEDAAEDQENAEGTAQHPLRQKMRQLRAQQSAGHA